MAISSHTLDPQDAWRRADAITLRPYQQEAIDALWRYWVDGGGNPLVEMATGTGKSLVIGELARRMMARRPRRVLILTHVKELIEQDTKAVRMVWPDAPIGICSAGLRERNVEAPIVIAGIQSVFRNPEVLGPRNLVVIDEAHLVPRDGEGMYLMTLAALRTLYPQMRVCGLTATPFRLDTGRLDEGEGRLFDRVVYSYGLAEAIADGWLASLVAKRTKSEIDTRGVARRGGEFVAGALEQAANADAIVEAAADEIVERGQARRSWLAFCAGVDHAAHVREALRARGIIAETVTGETPDGERADIVAAFHAGEIRCLTGANVFTTGFDVPAVDLIAMLRPPLSPGLYVQMLGRGTRKAEGKTNCEVLDFAGNVRRRGPVDTVTGPARPTGAGGDDEAGEGARAKPCPACNTYNPVAVLVCEECGYEWERPDREIRQPKHAARSDDITVLSSELRWLTVEVRGLYRHQQSGSRDSVKVEFRCGVSRFFDWLAFEHERSTVRSMAAIKWCRLGGETPAPTSVAEALIRRFELSSKVEIAIRYDEQFRNWRVVSQRGLR